jgi:hypothetical protein
MCLLPEDNRYVEVGEQVTLHIMADADQPVNVVGATIAIPTDYLTVRDVSREDSVIDLWAEEPSVNEDGDEVRFSGGIVRDDGFLGNARVLSIIVEPIAVGNATVNFSDVEMLAHDGTGMEVTCGQNPIVLSIRPAEHPSPDVNGDKVVNLFDFGIVSARLFMGYERSYDLNLDGKITLADIAVLFSSLRSKQGDLPSLAFGGLR